MSLRKIKHTFLRLTIEEKTIALGTLLMIIGIFSPWYSTNFDFNDSALVSSGVSGDLGVIGFTTVLFGAISLSYLISNYLGIRLPNFGYAKEKIILFFIGESAFLHLLALGIYTKKTFDFTNAEIRFGLYLSILGACIGAFSAYAQIKKNNKKEVNELFGYEAEEENIDEIQNEIDEKITQKEETSLNIINNNEKPQQKNFFYEMAENNEKDIEKEDALDLNTDHPKAEESHIQENQASYFTREAGIDAPEQKIKVDIDSVKKVEERSAPAKQFGSFYDDI